jgi:metallophosphoesterase (TIGR03767 family)
MSDAHPRGVTRRQVLGAGAAAAGAAAAGAVAAGAVAAGSLLRAGSAAGLDATPAAFPVAPAGSTLARTLQHGNPGTGGYRHIVPAAGEPTIERGDLLDGATRGSGTRTSLVSFAQLTDMHIIDAQSPARVEFLDRLDDPSDPLASTMPFSSAYRPWEMLTAHVAEAMVQAINTLAGGPVTGRPLDFTISTGDNADNTQFNELRWHIDLLDGGNAIRPDSGNLTKWEGVGDGFDYDTSYWHPDGSPPGSKPDSYRASFGYPTVPGLLDACRGAFTSTGLHTPWYSVFGNHDGLVQGTVPSLGVIGAVATASLKVTGLPLGLDVEALLARLGAGDATALAILLTLGQALLVTADRNRRMLDLKQTVAEHFTTTGTPVGHGYTQQNLDAGTAYYSFDPVADATVHCISLDTVNRNGYDDGSIDTTQLSWLTYELIANSSRFLDSSGEWVSGNGADKLIVIFSHHTIATMENVLGVNRVNGMQVRDLLLRFPNVLAWVNGHTHRNAVEPNARPPGAAVGGGFWEINTASHVDWPQQSRIVELADNGDGTLSIFATIVDHAAPAAWPATPSAPLELASLSRELAVNDPQRDAETDTRDGRRGTAQDRNVELLMRKPF